ncbi:beta-1,3-galactosyl-O-glycosyl-glycoprotein beta-1,6-N-acetylglucosaminyltransferase-like [Glandiceps talaboti]
MVVLIRLWLSYRSNVTVLTPKATNVICSEIIQGQPYSEDLINMSIQLLHDKAIPDRMFVSLINNCSDFLQTGGYTYKPVTQEEIDFPLAFSILMYRSVYQVEQLLRTIYRPHNIYCIHVDKKAPSELHTAMKAITSCFNNVFIASRLTNVVWGSISVVNAERYCQKDLLARNKKWKYLINLTGQEFPLKTNLEIVQILKQLQGQNDIMTSEKINPERTQHKFYEINGSMQNTTMEKTDPLPYNITIRKGELHCALTRPFVEFLHESEIAKEFLVWINDTYVPDESYYQSLASLPQAPGGPGLRQSSSIISRAKVWYKHEYCKGEFIHHNCVFSWRDLPWIVKRPNLFLHKLKVDYDPLVLHCLEELIYNRTVSPIQLNLDFYREFSKFKILHRLEDNGEWSQTSIK